MKKNSFLFDRTWLFFNRVFFKIVLTLKQIQMKQLKLPVTEGRKPKRSRVTDVEKEGLLDRVHTSCVSVGSDSRLMSKTFSV